MDIIKGKDKYYYEPVLPERKYEVVPARPGVPAPKDAGFGTVVFDTWSDAELYIEHMAKRARFDRKNYKAVPR